MFSFCSNDDYFGDFNPIEIKSIDNDHFDSNITISEENCDSTLPQKTSVTNLSSSSSSGIHQTLDTNNSNDKKNLKLMKNRECARQSRLRKRETIEKLFKENTQLKKDVVFLRMRLKENICYQCKQKITVKVDSKEGPQIVQSNSISPMKKVLLFTTFATILCLLVNCFYRYSAFTSSSISDNENLRKLNRTNPFVSGKRTDKTKHNTASLFISYEDYYFITTGRRYELYNEGIDKNGAIRFLKDEEIGTLPVEECPSCMVHLNKTHLVKNKKSKKKKKELKFKVKMSHTPFDKTNDILS